MPDERACAAKVEQINAIHLEGVGEVSQECVRVEAGSEQGPARRDPSSSSSKNEEGRVAPAFCECV